MKKAPPELLLGAQADRLRNWRLLQELASLQKIAAARIIERGPLAANSADVAGTRVDNRKNKYAAAESVRMPRFAWPQK
jgi:hypothetical protein